MADGTGSRPISSPNALITSRLNWKVPKGIRLALLTTSGERIDGETGDIRFFPDGSSTGGHVTLIQGERRSDVFVDWLSGRISVGESATLATQ